MVVLRGAALGLRRRTDEEGTTVGVEHLERDMPLPIIEADEQVFADREEALTEPCSHLLRSERSKFLTRPV